MLGLVGGVSAILWATLSALMGHYERFKLANSLIGSIYPTGPFPPAPQSEQAAFRSLLKTVSARGKYFYSYSEFALASLLSGWLCCRGRCWADRTCFRRRHARLLRHRRAAQMASTENAARGSTWRIA